MDDPKHVYKHIRVGNIWENIKHIMVINIRGKHPKGPSKGP